jgi:hypothetical protein
MHKRSDPPANVNIMGYKNDTEAFILANTYGFNPPRKRNPARLRIVDTGKYEPDHNAFAETRTIVLASWVDKTNILIQYTPAELVP